jgi:hypothetical protein
VLSGLAVQARSDMQRAAEHCPTLQQHATCNVQRMARTETDLQSREHLVQDVLHSRPTSNRGVDVASAGRAPAPVEIRRRVNGRSGTVPVQVRQG